MISNQGERSIGLLQGSIVEKMETVVFEAGNGNILQKRFKSERNISSISREME